MTTMEELLPPDATLRNVATGCTWADGPLWIPDRKCLRWSDLSENRILEYWPDRNETTVYMVNCEYVNGRALDLDNSVVQCSHGLRRIERDNDGHVSMVVNHLNGSKLNSPNDVIISRNGHFWFTDPHYGISVVGEGHPGVQEYGDCYVFSFNPHSEKLRAVVLDMEEPNGLAFSPDETILYVADSSFRTNRNGNGKRCIRAYDLINGRCKNGRTIIKCVDEVPDGLKIDHTGNIWLACGNSISIYQPDGKEIGKMSVPESVSNLCFGGRNGTDLYITASTSLYQIKTLMTDATRKNYEREASSRARQYS